MRVYVAARVGQEAELRVIHEKLKRAGFDVTLDLATAEMPEGLDGLGKQAFAIQDLHGIKVSDALILFHTISGGQEKFAELGIALALGKKCIVVVGPGVKDCIFFYLPGIKIVNTIEEALIELGHWRED